MTGRMMTRSPAWKFWTSGPISSMYPIASWPRMSPGCIAIFISPPYMCKSEPQMQQCVTRTTASLGAVMVGLGTSTMLTDLVPIHWAACIFSVGCGLETIWRGAIEQTDAETFVEWSAIFGEMRSSEKVQCLTERNKSEEQISIASERLRPHGLTGSQSPCRFLCVPIPEGSGVVRLPCIKKIRATSEIRRAFSAANHDLAGPRMGRQCMECCTVNCPLRVYRRWRHAACPDEGGNADTITVRMRLRMGLTAMLVDRSFLVPSHTGDILPLLSTAIHYSALKCCNAPTVRQPIQLK
ncbi:hypothetical protein KC360_g237 [Hortaea werneckii]|nr:hypothetical protein KC344_g239 [Hortaea werneckii]KAI7180402.1 hypothetical protein KC360_g237 [Hortaea werneckii]